MKQIALSLVVHVAFVLHVALWTTSLCAVCVDPRPCIEFGLFDGLRGSVRVGHTKAECFPRNDIPSYRHHDRSVTIRDGTPQRSIYRSWSRVCPGTHQQYYCTHTYQCSCTQQGCSPDPWT